MQPWYAKRRRLAKSSIFPAPKGTLSSPSLKATGIQRRFNKAIVTSAVVGAAVAEMAIWRRFVLADSAARIALHDSFQQNIHRLGSFVEQNPDADLSKHINAFWLNYKHGNIDYMIIEFKKNPDCAGFASSITDEMNTRMSVYSAFIFNTLAVPLWAVKLAKINRRIKLHKRYAQHAEALFTLMHNPEFMKEMGVDSWEKVTRERLKTEKWAQGFGFVPVLGSVLKPIAKVAARRKRDIPGLEKVLNHYLDGLEGKRSKKKSKWLATKPQEAMVAA